MNGTSDASGPQVVESGVDTAGKDAFTRPLEIGRELI